MVRRWSHLNNINSNFFSGTYKNTNDLLSRHNMTTFKSTTYYRNKLYVQDITKIRRKSFFRRRHLSNWLPYFFVLNNWALDYLFFRKYSKTLLAINLTKNNYIVYNNSNLLNSTVGETPQFNGFFITFLSSRVFNYCNSYKTGFLFFKKNISNRNLMLSSTLSDSFVTKTNVNKDLILLKVNGTMYTDPRLLKNTPVMLVPALIFRLHLSLNLSYYNTFLKSFVNLIIR